MLVYGPPDMPFRCCSLAGYGGQCLVLSRHHKQLAIETLLRKIIRESAQHSSAGDSPPSCGWIREQARAHSMRQVGGLMSLAA